MDFSVRNSLFYILFLGVLSMMVYALYTDQLILMEAIIVLLLGVLVAPYFLHNISNGLLAIVFLAPLSVDVLLPGGMKLSAPAEILSVLFLALFAVKWAGGLVVDTKLLKHPVSIILALDLAWTIIVAFASELPAVALKRVVLKILFFAVYYFLFAHFFTKVRQFKNMYWLYSLGFVLPIFSALYKHAELGFMQRGSIIVSQPFYADHTVYAASLAFVIPFLVLTVFYKKWNSQKWVALGLFGLFSVAVMLSYSRAAWISLGGVLAFYVLVKFKMKFWQLALILVVVGTGFWLNFDPIYQELSRSKVKYGDDVTTHLSSVTNLQNDASNLERINRWVSAYRMFESKPITGYGPGTYQFIYDRFQTPEYMTRISTHNGDKGNAHSEYFTYLAENGIIGFLIFTTLVLYSIYLAMKLLRLALTRDEKLVVFAAILGLLTFYIHGLFNTFSDYEKMAVLYLGSLAVLVRTDIRKEAER